MRLKGRQARFLLATLGCWAAARTYMLWPTVIVAAGTTFSPRDGLGTLALVEGSPARPFRRWDTAVPVARRPVSAVAGPAREAWYWDREDREARLMLLALGGPEATSAAKILRRATFASESDAPAAAPQASAPAQLFPPSRTRARTIEAQAYVFLRPGGSQPSVAGGGELGGSQLAARLAWRPPDSAFGVAARLYAPIGHRGAEAAAGVDWHPIAAVPFRISAERRQRLDRAGRSAWAAYAAGGFYRGGAPGALEADGYAQAGVVGMRRRDGFVDGALRIGYRLPTRQVAVVFGAGAWGAAQPGVSRVDIGPRAAVRLPVAAHMLTLAIDGRFRIAGRADPGSGAALTIAADF